MYVINLLLVKELIVNSIRFEATEEKAVSWIHTHLKKDIDNKEYRYVHSDNKILVYQMFEGYVFNSKDLIKIYFLNEYKHPLKNVEVFKDSKED